MIDISQTSKIQKTVHMKDKGRENQSNLIQDIKFMHHPKIST